MLVRMPPRVTVVAVVLLTLSCAAPPPADTPEARAEGASAVARIEIQGGALDQTLDLGAAFALEQAAAELAFEIGRDLTEDERARVEEVMRAALADVLTEERFSAAVSEVYAAHFTAAELADVAAFYETPTGKRVLGILATVTREIGDATEGIIEEHLESFIGSVDERLAEAFPELAGEGQP